MRTPHTSDSLGSILGQRLAERMVELSRPGLIIVDNSAVPVTEQAASPEAPAPELPPCPIVQAEARIRRYRLNRSKRSLSNLL